ncbi:hypothetical protein ACNKU7_00390 [Microbulbifer sp. SA54]|uniref:bestrophin-like domain n=1 Tax=Microbulbifer sp. SA54 TaxID=3401577 RepID=UPI003AADE5B3
MKILDAWLPLPLAGVYFGCFLLVMVALAFGYAAGRRFTRRHETLQDASLGSAVAATLGLLAFMLAFTFNMTADRFSQRKALLMEDVNAIGTTYLRADFLSEEGRGEARTLLREYAALRSFSPNKFGEEEFAQANRRTEEIQKMLWALVDRHLQQNFDPTRLRAFYEPLNQMIDLHALRIQVGMVHKIPTAIWVALYAITAFAMFGMGMQLGVSGSASPLAAVALALSFSLVIVLIADLDRSYEGWLLVDQGPMKALAESLKRGAEIP